MIIFERNDIRISLITPRLLRTEKGVFTDLATQTVQNRYFQSPSYTVEESNKYIIVKTDEVCYKVDLRSGDVISVTLDDGTIVKDFEAGRLPGTARTLDTVNGKTRLEAGITSRSGASVMDDSASLLIDDDGAISPRTGCRDRYWFAYGNDHLRQLKDFFCLTGKVPLIPKFALGNWWSRYKAYTQEEYRTLMQKFIDREIPITVATIDMDWHWTDVVDRFGEVARPEKPKCPQELLYYAMPGWTGYSWNTELFPDHRELLSWLHERGFRVTLNIHPSQGVRAYEDQYGAMCKMLDKDPSKKELIPFDVTDDDFMRAYFKALHHPLEDEGVDFWWIDWQQGTKTKMEGLDPLWALNHYHTLDSGRGDRRPLILSRYAGLGSHRYPLGFSGDTICTWKSLDFQPYFTSSAANAGYTWWSHDIGGHTHGIQNDELYLRWLQYGVFSPINRLHSSNSEFMGKEPWKRSWAVGHIAERFLRLRHKMIPYLYSANYRTHTLGEPICMPMYYRYSQEDAYLAKNQYIFGGQLVVCPITRPIDKRLNLAYADVWLPKGEWTDIFNGRKYMGDRWVRMYRDIDSIPVLAPQGAIIPMYQNDRTNDLSLDQPLEIHIYSGNGYFELYDDDGESTAFEQGHSTLTAFKLEKTSTSLLLTVTPSSSNGKVFSTPRKMIIKLCDLEADDICITVGEEPVVVDLSHAKALKKESLEEMKNIILTRVQGSNTKKSITFKKGLPAFVKDAISELDALIK